LPAFLIRPLAVSRRHAALIPGVFIETGRTPGAYILDTAGKVAAFEEIRSTNMFRFDLIAIAYFKRDF
jgi:hypothetical protein